MASAIGVAVVYLCSLH